MHQAIQALATSEMLYLVHSYLRLGRRPPLESSFVQQHSQVEAIHHPITVWGPTHDLLKRGMSGLKSFNRCVQSEIDPLRSNGFQ
jgi:hypothetical protein